MQLKQLLNTYHAQLDAIFGKEEVDSFFNIAIGHYLDMARIALVLEPDLRITEEDAKPLLKVLSDLNSQKPIQYSIGVTEFFGLPFQVNSHTLIPRPETEELVALALEDLKTISSVLDAPIQILDIGTGSGCIAIAIAKHFENAKVSAVDISEEALKVAGQNALVNDVNVDFSKLDILSFKEGGALKFDGFDLIISNPPYVREQEKSQMQANVLDNEPHLALFVKDESPLVFYQTICEFAQNYLKPGGRLYFEINEYLGKEMVQLLNDHNFTEIELNTDIFGKDRMIKGVL
ncbi:peptide chain release factor N(5)-glutamine methyltransferase [Sediminibacter sp. Hel_I_10]|uniref:peptide chain release factor N(5)-glutamine methyltransferase n=1 Tax=Sediminibacter sp. Hel_I_10 TaxID=1392490 RepID=UPI00047A2D56|nr:peptide chain release factor N(5)-glutamine methyltransferase [Sediminibacter sp. Hel_I_10]